MSILSNWNVLCWNIRGMNSDPKLLALSNAIATSGCSVICLQETKREHFDVSYIINFCANRLNKFSFLPSIGASGGLLITWNGSLFEGEVIFQNRFSLSISFTSLLSKQS